ncbi:SCO2584 family spore wall biosynthesis protein [Streptomyces triticagri]
MPEDVGGTPFPDGREPDDSHDRGGADDAFASVVFDEAFVRSAEFHEPTAVERLLAAAEARRARGHGSPGDDDPEAADGPGDYGERTGYGTRYVFGTGAFARSDAESDDDADEPEYAEGPYARRGNSRWHRPVAWLLALVMGVGMVALAFAAVYRGSSSGRQDPTPPPATTGVDQAPSASADYSQPPVPAEPRLP